MDKSAGEFPSYKPWSKPTRLISSWYSVKRIVHTARRSVLNWLQGPSKVSPAKQWGNTPLLSEIRSPLWSGDREDEFILRCGKVQNLRVATRLIHGLEFQAGEVFSFWTQVGKPVRRRGFVDGREIMSGCVVPTVGGGICQLTNALAQAVQHAGLKFIERHGHSALIEGQIQQNNRLDATVAWNHIDLRFSADFPFRLESFLTQNELVVRIQSPRHGKSTFGGQPRMIPIAAQHPLPVARGCLTCDETSCFRHRSGPPSINAKTALLLNTRSPEFEQWLHEHIPRADWMIPWHRKTRQTASWNPPAGQRTHVALGVGLLRTLSLQLAAGEGGQLQAVRQQDIERLARSYARQLRPEHTELVVSQELLVPLWKLGVLGGRTYDVLASQLPASEIQFRLDQAAERYPAVSELRDFRIAHEWADTEWQALAGARRIITSHVELATCLQDKGIPVQTISWAKQTIQQIKSRKTGKQPTLVFASSALPRKGSIEVARAARELSAQVLILGSPPVNDSEWKDVNWTQVGYNGDWISRADIVLLPAYIEHQPRSLLKALAHNVPVIATPACGLGQPPGLYLIQPGDLAGLMQAIQEVRETREALT